MLSLGTQGQTAATEPGRCRRKVAASKHNSQLPGNGGTAVVLQLVLVVGVAEGAAIVHVLLNN